MREKNFSTGLRGVLFEAKHYERMGPAIWLYGWLVLRQTHQSRSMGWVLGGKPVSYREIEEETGFNPRTLERWMSALRKKGYVETETAPDGVIVRITKAKKFAQPTRKSADGVRRNAWGGPQSCGRSSAQYNGNQEFASRISSSSVVGEKTKADGSCSVENQSQKQIPNPSQNQNRGPNSDYNPWHSANSRRDQNSPQFFPETQARAHEHSYAVAPGNALGKQLWSEFAERRRYALFRAEQEEAVRRELRVGTGPEPEGRE